LFAGATAAQTAGVVGRVLVLDQERLFSQSQYGQRIISEIESRTDTLRAQARLIESQLEEEELSLTELRQSTEADAFRTMADAFDKKVESLRDQQNQKSIELNAWIDARRRGFLEDVSPLLLQLANDMEASVILNPGAVFLSARNIDITDQAIQRVDAALGAGDSQEP